MFAVKNFVALFLVLTVLAVATLGAPQSRDLAAQWAGAAASGNGRVGKPNLHYGIGGAGNDARNWGARADVGVGVKAWESQNRRHSVGVGANYGQSFGRSQGHFGKGRPDFGVGAGYNYRFG